jgi:hypothetical protein
MKKRVLISILLIFMTLIILSNLLGNGWIVYHEGSFKGKVIDAETKEPIEGAVAVVVYNVREYAFIESNTTASSAEEVLTNKNGDFYIPHHIFFHIHPYLLATKETTHFLIYKPGYAPAEGPDYVQRPDGFIIKPNYPMIAEAFRKGVIVELVRLKTKEERIRNIPSRPDDMGSWRLPLLFKAINEEGKRFGLGEVR